MEITQALLEFIQGTAFLNMDWRSGVMILVACLFLYLAIKKGFEPLLLVPISFGMLLANIPLGGVMAPPTYELMANHMGPISEAGLAILNNLPMVRDIAASQLAGSDVFIPLVETLPLMQNGVPVLKEVGGLLYYLYQGDHLGIFPPLIFLGIGAMTDFGPLIANPKSLFLGAAAQFGVFITFWGALLLHEFVDGIYFTYGEAASIGIIGGADGPTAIYLATKLAPDLLGPIAVAAYSYMAMVPLIIPPVAKLFTTKHEREIVMTQLRPVHKTTKILFPIVNTIIVSFIVPAATPLIGMLMLGNLFKESGVTDRLSETAQNALINIVTIFLGVSVGATAIGADFLTARTMSIFVLGVFAFAGGTAGGVLVAKTMNLFLKNKINPLIGAAGVSAVPMAARVAQKMGQQANPKNFLLMHAMGPNVAGVIGTAVAAGILLTLFK